MELRVSPCSRETGRERYNLSRTARIPFEHREPPPHFIDPVTAAGLNDEDFDPDTHFTPPSSPDETDGTSEDEDEDDDDDVGNAATAHGNAEPGEHDFPAVSAWRLNLTALSQRYNLYFAAYRHSIHVSRPLSCSTHSLPPVPDLVLAPAASKRGMETIGVMDADGHQVNHLIVGLLGREEILLMAYDDGDVIGYYTGQIEDSVYHREKDPSVGRHSLVPFFHENVRRSAWGLAIHQQSRLIAVGSNDHVATVFIPAIKGAAEEGSSGPESSGPGLPSSSYSPSSSIVEPWIPNIRTSEPTSLFCCVKKNEHGQVVSSSLKKRLLHEPEEFLDLYAMIHARHINWRIELPTGPEGHNIPNLTFSSTKDGDADKVLAVDVLGNLWVMDFWHRQPIPHLKIVGIHMPRHIRGVMAQPRTIRPMGWGVLVIPESCFLPTNGFWDSLGLHQEDAKFVDHRNDRWIDISRGIQHVPNNSTIHRWSRRASNAFQWEHSQLVETHTWYDPQEKVEYPYDWDRSKSQGKWKPAIVLGDGSSILRTYETDIELRPFEDGGIGVMYEHATRQMRRPDLGPARLAMERLGNILFVPELSLVVGASMAGRVALITLTRPEPGDDVFGLKRGFKIEAILPTKEDEDKNLRPLCPLYGVAVGPLPQSRGSKRKVANERYRLMIHYYDLSILSYEISRDPGTKELSIVFGV